MQKYITDARQYVRGIRADIRGTFDRVRSTIRRRLPGYEPPEAEAQGLGGRLRNAISTVRTIPRRGVRRIRSIR